MDSVYGFQVQNLSSVWYTVAQGDWCYVNISCALLLIHLFQQTILRATLDCSVYPARQWITV